ncbi:MAG: MarR family transcriptional regulator [Candidatus Latescibacteria bacterium]|nr:MarR family transcriptional regulator [Candidatus Latescibacterota bacterium]
MIELEVYRQFLHHAHIFASTVREILEEKYLRQTTTLDVTVPQFNLLKLIAHNGKHQVGELASFLGVSQAAASKNVDKLVRLKLIIREVQQSDRRAASLSLTHKGKSVIHRYEALKEEKLKEILESLTAGELATLMQGLEKVAHLILEKELDRNRCMRCNAYYVKSCLLKPLCGNCLYLQTRERSYAEAVVACEAGS